MNPTKEIPLKRCPKCGKPLETRHGEYGTYLDCTGYPECKFTQELSRTKRTKSRSTAPAKCPKCGKKLAIYMGKFGIFLGCNGYPDCNYLYNFEDPTNISCPECGKTMMERIGKYGIFYGCRGYPECRFTFNVRISKEKTIKKKLEISEIDSFSDVILCELSNEWKSIHELSSKLKIANEPDAQYLHLKLKEFERKGIVQLKVINDVNYWKKHEIEDSIEVRSITERAKTKNKKEMVYVLRLENEKWWVGRSTNLSSSINRHKEGMGSSWTRDNRVIKTEEIIEDGDLTDITLRCMKKHGWENVRGTCFNDFYYIYIPKKIKVYIKSQEGGLEFFVEKEKSLGPKFVYTLKLEHGKWYVGRTVNVARRVGEMKEKGNTWTQMHKILGLEEIFEKGDLKQITLDYMRKYGWENVRGYAWSQWDMKYPPKELRK